MEKRWEYTWKAFWIRQLKVYVPTLPLLIFIWNSVEYGRVIHEYFGWAFEGYGPPQQRWYRVVASGFILMCMFGSLIDALSVWHYLKNPDKIPKDDEK
jgi:hypothetical protein